MEREKKRARGWWALAGIGVLTLLGLYVSAYYVMVKPFAWHHNEDGTASVWPTYAEKPTTSVWWERVFTPIHEIDRLVRPSAWDPASYPDVCPDWPIRSVNRADASDVPPEISN